MTPTSVVIRTHNEAPRLALTLASLERQASLGEVVVVDDGSSDDTADVIATAKSRLPLVAVRHDRARGRSAASNAGARAATADLLIFLDGDTLAGPGMVAAHARLERPSGKTIARGETWHLRSTRFLSNPTSGEFWPLERARGDKMNAAEREGLRVTPDQVRWAFDEIEVRASPGIYPGTGPARLYELEMAALGGQNRAAPLWAAASGSNLSLPRQLFLDAGGFDETLDLNEHRELAYRLISEGARIVPAPGARSYHLTHRSGWRDPLVDTSWREAFEHRHPGAPISELIAFWREVADPAARPAFF